VHRIVETFLGEIRREQTELDRMLATVLLWTWRARPSSSSIAAIERGAPSWNAIAQHVRSLLARYRGVEVDTAGDGVFATFEGPARAILCATAIAEDSAALGLEARAGVHTGEVEIADGKIAGLASTSVPASASWPRHPRCSCHRRSAISWQAQGSGSRIVASTS